MYLCVKYQRNKKNKSKEQETIKNNQNYLGKKI